MTDEIDDLVRAAAKAHEALGAQDHFDGLSDRVMARISAGATYAPLPDAREVEMMSETDDPIPGQSSPRGSAPPPRAAGSGDGVPERTEDSGLHDVKSLAQTTKQRISRRITSQHDAYDESLLNSSQSGLRAVALPAPAQVVSLPDLPGAAGAADVASGAGAAVTPIGAARGKRKTVWYVAGAGVLAAAAAAAFIVAGGGGDKKDEGQYAAGADSASAVEQYRQQRAPSAGEALAMGSGSAAAGHAAGSGTTSVVALDPGATKPDESAPKSDQKPADKAETDRQDVRTGAGGGGSAGGGTDTGGAKPSGGKKGGDSVKGGGGGGSSAGSGSAKAGGGGDSIEDLLNEASGGAQKPTEGSGGGGGGGGGGPAAPEKTGLDGKDIRSGMSAVASKAQGCFDQHGVAGHVKIKAVVDSSGKVTKADATGEFAGTPTGTCVAGAAKSASFPSWTGAPMTISYGFTLVE